MRCFAPFGQPTTRAALRLAPYVFVRPGELRQGERLHVVELVLSIGKPSALVASAASQWRCQNSATLGADVVPISAKGKQSHTVPRWTSPSMHLPVIQGRRVLLPAKKEE
jgi:hypothetical protein